MRKFSAGLLMLGACAVFNGALERPPFSAPAWAQEETAEAAANKEDAQILFSEALDLKKAGKMPEAIDTFARAMRLDRSILAQDDQGLIEALKKDCEEKLLKTPDDVKLLETLGFVHAVCYSDHKSAIECYEKVFNLVTDEKVKERTASLIERLRETDMAQSSYQQEVSAQLRDERLKSWSEMEKLEKFGEETAANQAKSAQLAEAYKQKDSLKNKIPQLEEELKDLQEQHAKAKRLWYSLKDDLYDRRKGRLEDDIAAKEAELSKARSELEEIESTSATLERELSAVEKEKEASPIRSYDENSATEPPQEGDEPPAQPPSNDYGAPPDDGQPSGEPLPAGNPDFPSEGSVGGPGAGEPLVDDSDTDDSGNSGDAGSDNSGGKLDELIENL